MRYLPLTPEEKKKILDECGVGSFDELIAQVPQDLRVRGLLDLEPALSEPELKRHLGKLARNNAGAHMQSHLGQGVYDHEWPVVIDQLCNRGEFLTAYTPYQPEISQGTLQAIFEFQSMVADLYGMDVANASLYDGATSVLEGILMAARLQSLPKGIVYVSEGTYKRTRQLLETYLGPLGFKIETWKANPKTFLAESTHLPSPSEPVAAIVLQSPNKWGLVENWDELAQAATRLGTKSVGYASHPHSLAAFASPGERGIDIAVGEGQPLGIPVGYGGPHLGLFACRKKDVRQMPGRLVGATLDARQERAFCVTLSTREQHIRREKATSNICSNQSLMALRATMYLTLMGPEGFRKAADLSRAKAWYAREQLTKALRTRAPELKLLEGEIFNEITVLSPPGRSLWHDEILAYAEERGVLAGTAVEVPAASGYVSGLALAFTERHTKAEIDNLVEILSHSSEGGTA